MSESKTITALRTWRLRGRDNKAPITPELAMYLATNKAYDGWYLPTEMVVMKPQMVVPKQASYWEVWASDVRKLLGWNEVQWPDMLHMKHYDPTPGLKTRVTKSSQANFAYIIEDHEDHGDDGHTACELVSYHLLTPAGFQTYLKFRNEHNEQGWKYDGDQYHIQPCDEYCESCKQWTVKEDWVGDTPDSYPRCPNCGMC